MTIENPSFYQNALHLYYSRDLSGDFLVQPLKQYQQFFAEKIEQSEGLKQLAYRVAQVFTALLAYPILGTLAVIGTAFKLTGISALVKHNEKAKECLIVFPSLVKQDAKELEVEIEKAHGRFGYTWQNTVDHLDFGIKQAIEWIDTATQGYSKIKYLNAKHDKATNLVTIHIED